MWRTAQLQCCIILFHPAIRFLELSCREYFSEIEKLPILYCNFFACFRLERSLSQRWGGRKRNRNFRFVLTYHIPGDERGFYALSTEM